MGDSTVDRCVTIMFRPVACCADLVWVILSQEPPGLAIGKVNLHDGEEVLGVIGEPLTVEGKKEITEFGGWRAYQEAS